MLGFWRGCFLPCGSLVGLLCFAVLCIGCSFSAGDFSHKKWVGLGWVGHGVWWANWQGVVVSSMQTTCIFTGTHLVWVRFVSESLIEVFLRMKLQLISPSGFKGHVKLLMQIAVPRKASTAHLELYPDHRPRGLSRIRGHFVTCYFTRQYSKTYNNTSAQYYYCRRIIYRRINLPYKQSPFYLESIQITYMMVRMSAATREESRKARHAVEAKGAST